MVMLPLKYLTSVLFGYEVAIGMNWNRKVMKQLGYLMMIEIDEMEEAVVVSFWKILDLMENRFLTLILDSVVVQKRVKQ